MVVGETDMPTGPPHAFRWTQAGGMQDLGRLGTGLASQANAVSTDGSVVAGYAAGRRMHMRSAGRRRADAGSGHGGGLKLTTATSVSGDGNTVVGYADPTVS